MNKETLDRYVEEGWLIKQTHPSLPLTIYNYSQATQYDGKEYSQMIWRLIKPEYEKPFSNKHLES